MLDGRDPVAVSYDLLRAVRTGARAQAGDLFDELAAVGSMALAEALGEDAGRTAFWLNVYNAVVQHQLAAEPSRYDSKLRFFRRDRMTVAGESLSLDDVENGILRRSMLGWGLGYLPRPFPSGFELTHRVEELDPRIHFALNCGAASCPPVAAYTRDGLDAELDLATESYLDQGVDYDAEAGVVSVPRLLLWYRGDFGGRSGILELLGRYGAVPPGATPSVRYDSYDWSLALDNYRDAAAPVDSDEERRPAV